MIAYRYEPYRPDDENPWNTERLMSILSEMVMRHDMRLEEALKALIDRGLPANVFIKEAGMGDLVEQFLKELQAQQDGVLETYEIESALKETMRDLRAHRHQLEKKLPKEDVPLVAEAMDRASADQLYELKWNFMREPHLRDAAKNLDPVIRDVEDHNTISAGMKKYTFTGKQHLTRSQALLLLDQLADLDKLIESLKNAVENGDLFNFDLEDLAKYLGPEQYQEFLERREAIFEKLRKLLEKQGRVVRDEETGEMKLSPQTIRRIGRQALEHIFSAMKADLSGGSHEAKETGDSDNVSTRTKPFEFGDSFANVDIASTVVNALVRTGKPVPSFRDMEVFEPRGSARSATVVLLDMSGSMMRADRFFNAKKMVLALDSLIREDYRDDRLIVVGFGTFAKAYNPAEIPTLQPFPVTIFDPHIRMRIDMAKSKGRKEHLPQYFTNLQRGLQLARTLLGTGETKNKQIILVTDGVPTAHFESNILHVNYPPSPADFEASLREVRHCTEDGIVINTFLLTSDWEMTYFGEESFIKQFAKQSMGRIFYPHPRELNKMILVDFIANHKKQFTV